MVVGEQGAGGAGSVSGLVVPDGGGEGEESLLDSCGDASAGARAVAFEPELGFEGLEDGFDDLAQRPQEPLPGSGGFGFGGGADEGDARVVELGFEGGAAVALVGDEGLAAPGHVGVGDHVQADVAFVGFRAGESVGDGQPRRCCEQVQAQAPEVPRVAGAVTVGGPSGEVRALLGLAAAPALHRRGVHDPDVVIPRRAVPRQRSEHVGHQLAAAAQALVVASPLGQIGEPRRQVFFGVANEAGLGVEPQQGLQHRQGHQLRIGQFRRDSHRGPQWRPLRMRHQQIINCHVQCSREGVQVRVHVEPSKDRRMFTPQILDTLTHHTADPYPLELLI